MTHHLTIAAATLVLGLGLGSAARADAVQQSQLLQRNQADIDANVQFDRLYRPERYMKRHHMPSRDMMRYGDVRDDLP